MLIRFGFRIAISVMAPTPVLLRLDVNSDRRHDIVREAPLTMLGSEISPPHVDLHGNLCRRVMAYPGLARFETAGIAYDCGQYEHQLTSEPATPVELLPDEVLPYLTASRYCEVDELGSVAWAKFGHLPKGAAQVTAIIDFVHRALTFGYQYARITRTAADALNENVGVCRDFAHTTIALCRALNIPARYVNGYLGDIGVPRDPAPMDFSAWVEVFLDGKWHAVDARHNRPRIGRIVLARGRDAADVPLIHSFGPHWLQEFKVITEAVDEADAAVRPVYSSADEHGLTLEQQSA